jgi:beta-galactosidase
MTAVFPDFMPSSPQDTSTLRMAARTEGDRGFPFVNNTLRHYPLPEQKGVQVRMKLPSETITLPREPVNIPSQSSFV